jgi:hypothetical protein
MRSTVALNDRRSRAVVMRRVVDAVDGQEDRPAGKLNQNSRRHRRT